MNRTKPSNTNFMPHILVLPKQDDIIAMGLASEEQKKFQQNFLKDFRSTIP